MVKQFSYLFDPKTCLVPFYMQNAFLVGKAKEHINKGDPIYFSDDNTISRSMAADPDAGEVIGVSLKNASPGEEVFCVQSGVIVGCMKSATFGEQLFLDHNGGLCDIFSFKSALKQNKDVLFSLNRSKDEKKSRIWRIGYMKNSTDMVVTITDLGVMRA